KAELREGYGRLIWQLRLLIPKGLSAAVYTQTTDVETEVNGLMTYDREVIKVDVKETAAWHAKLFGPPLKVRTLVATSEEAGQKWRWTTWRATNGWEKPGYDDSKWKEGEGGFGTKGTPGAVVRTTWSTKSIWLRRVVEVKGKVQGEVMLRLHHDEDADVYINGVLA